MKDALQPKSPRRKKAQSANTTRHSQTWEVPHLFEMPEARLPEPTVKRPSYPVWTENKARFIERYLYYFVLITKHGTYLDGFAGPQRPEEPRMWAAQLVLDSEPRWLRHFHLCDLEGNRWNTCMP